MRPYPAARACERLYGRLPLSLRLGDTSATFAGDTDKEDGAAAEEGPFRRRRALAIACRSAIVDCNSILRIRAKVSVTDEGKRSISENDLYRLAWLKMTAALGFHELGVVEYGLVCGG